MKALIHYGEIALKKHNRSQFEKKLIQNIENQTKGKITKLAGRFILDTKNLIVLNFIPGIEWWAKVTQVKTQKEEIYKNTIKLVREKIKKVHPKTFGLIIKNSNSPFSWRDIAIELGDILRTKFSLKVNLDKPDLSIYMELLSKNTFIFFEKNRGIGGLPVSISGTALSLFSGGIDSPVSTFFSIKRGLKTDLLYVGSSKSFDKKIFPLIRQLRKFEGEIVLFTLDCQTIKTFIEKFTKEKNFTRYRTLIFRKILLESALLISKERKYDVIVTGDSIGQVASQTVKNLTVVSKNYPMLIIRPLIGLNKNEIIKIAKKIGTYEISIAKSFDCCSMFAQKPVTYANEDVFAEITKTPKFSQFIHKLISSKKSFTFK